MVSLTCPSLQTLGKTQTVVISYFRISAQSLLKENCHNSRTSDDIDMKLGPLTKIDKRNKATSKKKQKKKRRWHNARKLWRNCHFSDLWPIWSNPEAGFRTDSKKLIFSLNLTFYLTKAENRTKKLKTQLSHYCFEERYYFCQKMLIFCKKMLTSAKLRGPWYWKVYLLKLNVCTYIQNSKFLG